MKVNGGGHKARAATRRKRRNACSKILRNLDACSKASRQSCPFACAAPYRRDRALANLQRRRHVRRVNRLDDTRRCRALDRRESSRPLSKRSDQKSDVAAAQLVSARKRDPERSVLRGLRAP